MRAIIVDDEQIMLRSFMRLSKGISNLNVIAQFENPEEALLICTGKCGGISISRYQNAGDERDRTGSEDSRDLSEYFNRVYFRLR